MEGDRDLWSKDLVFGLGMSNDWNGGDNVVRVVI